MYFYHAVDDLNCKITQDITANPLLHCEFINNLYLKTIGAITEFMAGYYAGIIWSSTEKSEK
jgi:hypothetical protein